MDEAEYLAAKNELEKNKKEIEKEAAEIKELKKTNFKEAGMRTHKLNFGLRSKAAKLLLKIQAYEKEHEEGG